MEENRSLSTIDQLTYLCENSAKKEEWVEMIKKMEFKGTNTANATDMKKKKFESAFAYFPFAIIKKEKILIFMNVKTKVPSL